MQIKRFEARDMTQALRRVKQEFGSDAVILSARTLSEARGVFGFLRQPKVEITAATDISVHNNRGIPARSSISVFDDSCSYLPPPSQPNEKPRLGSSFQRELTALKTKFSVLKGRNKDKERDDGMLATLHQLMLCQEVEPDLASDLLKGIEKRTPLPSSDGPDNNLIQVLTRAFKRGGITGGPLKPATGKKNIVAFIGPTGVGKTTTIMKLAAVHTLKGDKRVALITLDADRIAAIEQIRTFAKIIGLPVAVVFGKKELKALVERFKGIDLILIDTPGMSQKNEFLIKELRDDLETGLPTEIHLVVSATTMERDLADTIDKFGVIPLSRLLFTKVDECTTFGHIINQLLVSKLPASYFTNGQQIPEDLHPADPEKLAELIVHHQLSSSDQSSNLSDPGFDAHESGLNTYRLRKESYVANKNSTRFHASESKCARRMRAENIVVFKTLTEALNQKFTPCRYCCKGMDKTLSAPHKLAG